MQVEPVEECKFGLISLKKLVKLQKNYLKLRRKNMSGPLKIDKSYYSSSIRYRVRGNQ